MRNRKIFAVFMIMWMANISPMDVFVLATGCPNSITNVVKALSVSEQEIGKLEMKTNFVKFAISAFLLDDKIDDIQFMSDCCMRVIGPHALFCLSFVSDLAICYHDPSLQHLIPLIKQEANVKLNLRPYIMRCFESTYQLIRVTETPTKAKERHQKLPTKTVLRDDTEEDFDEIIIYRHISERMFKLHATRDHQINLDMLADSGSI